MRRLAGPLTVALVAALLAAAHQPAAQPAATARTAAGYLVFYTDGDAARTAVRRAGGSTLREEPKLGYLLAAGPGERFVAALDAEPSVVGVTADGPVGFASARPRSPVRPAPGRPVSRQSVPVRAMPDVSGPARTAEPLAGRQWNLRMIGAPRTAARAPGDGEVLVGVIDTGVDGGHPDIAPAFDRDLSRNFVTDIPAIDGPCEVPSCRDPVDVDEDGHGTHVAGTIASPRNGVGVVGVAPGARIISLRAGQDSGYFFLKPTLDALTYAADIGVDVVNMSYYIDPWMFNCAANRADSGRQRRQQRAVRTGVRRALDYAHARGVTLISALGNESLDLGRPRVDHASPNYPPGREKTRRVNTSCLNLPAEGRHVISVAALGPSGRKAGYSNYGLEQTDLSAPGGDGGGLRSRRSVLAAAPERALRASGAIDSAGEPVGDEVVRDCSAGTCSYYQYLDGTSMAAPHVTGVAAILISRFGVPGPGGLRMDPDRVARLLYATATRKPCPRRAVRCAGGKKHNGFYGRGVVNALRAATVQP